MQEEPRKGFIEELQELEEGTKRKVLFVATGVAMIVVVYLWLGYFNTIISGVAQTPFTQSGIAQQTPSAQQGQGAAAGSAGTSGQAPQTAIAAQPAPSQSGGTQPGFFGRVGIGMAYVYGQFIGLFTGLAHMLEGPRQYIIKPK